MEDAFEIRKCIERDIPAVKKLHIQLFPVRYDDDFFTGLLADTAIARVLVDKATSKIVGVATGFFQRKSTDTLGLGYGSNVVTVFYLSTFGIHADYRRKQLGHRLLRYMLDLAKSACESDVVVLHVKTLNEAAIAFYEKNGFVLVKRKKDHYNIGGRDYDALKMCHHFTHKGRESMFPAPGYVDLLSSCIVRVLSCCFPKAEDEDLLIKDEKNE